MEHRSIWPGQAPFSVLVTVDVDGDLPLLAEDPANIDRHKSRSAGLYGVEAGAPRLLRLFAALGVPADWFVPGRIAERFPELIGEIAAAGHGLAVHGHRHLDFGALTLDEQLEEMTLGAEALTAITGSRPTGFRTPGGEWADGFPERMAELGFRWSSSLPGDELPFALTGSGLVEIPFRYDLEDQQALGYNLDPPFPPGQSRIMPLPLLEENWRWELKGSARYGTLFHLRLNAEVAGIASRTRLVGRLLEEARAAGAWFATADGLRAQLLRLEPAGDPDHPYSRFVELRALLGAGGSDSEGRR